MTNTSTWVVNGDSFTCGADAGGQVSLPRRRGANAIMLCHRNPQKEKIFRSSIMLSLLVYKTLQLACI
jgi:hypothetical protein